jgi:mono/diheme cytochrome c family protein
LSVTGARIGPPSRSLENFVRYVRRPGGAMPAMGEQVVPEADLADVYAFLRTMPAPKPAAEVPLLRQLKSPGR